MKRDRIFSIIGTFALCIFALVLAMDPFHFCTDDLTCKGEMGSYGAIFFPVLPVFFASFFAYFLSGRFYKAWFGFSAFFVVASAVLLLSEMGHGGGFGVVTSGGSDIPWLWMLYLIISVPLIIAGYIVNLLHRRK